MKKSLTIALLSVLLLSSAAHAEESAAPTPYTKVGTITVNLKGLTNFLQTDISLLLVNPELAATIKDYQPVIRHELILLLSNQDPLALTTLTGKQKLSEQIRVVVNKALKLDPRRGVAGVFFESFIIQ